MSKNMTREQEKAMFAKKDTGKSYRKDYSTAYAPSTNLYQLERSAKPMTKHDYEGLAGAPPNSKVVDGKNYTYVFYPSGEVHAISSHGDREYMWTDEDHVWKRII